MRNATLHRLAAALLLSLGAGCGSSLGPPDGSWTVHVVSTDAADFGEICPAGGEYKSIDTTFTYDMYVDGSAVELRIGEEVFATGAYTSGCTVEYATPAYLDSYQGDEVQWQIEGTAVIDGPAGGCVENPELDWDGIETAVVVRSETDNLPMGCTRDMTVTGTRAN